MLIIMSTQIYEILPPLFPVSMYVLSLAYAHLPHHVKRFGLGKDEHAFAI